MNKRLISLLLCLAVLLGAGSLPASAEEGSPAPVSLQSGPFPGESRFAYLDADGGLWYDGQLQLTEVSRVWCPSYNTVLALRTDGTLWMKGTLVDHMTQPVLTDYVEFTQIRDKVAELDGSASDLLVVQTDGSLWYYGIQTDGQWEKVTTGIAAVRLTFEAGTPSIFYLLAVTEGGELVLLEYNPILHTTEQVARLDGGMSTRILAGRRLAPMMPDLYCFGVKEDGTLWSYLYHESTLSDSAACVGEISSDCLNYLGGTLANPDAALSSVRILEDAVDVQAGPNECYFALKSDGSVWTWGNKLYQDGLQRTPVLWREDDAAFSASTAGVVAATGDGKILEADGTGMKDVTPPAPEPEVELPPSLLRLLDSPDREGAAYSAQALYELGLFQGTLPGRSDAESLALDRRATRVEGLVMFLRLYGVSEAEIMQPANAQYNHFTDVPEWATHYAGYASHHGWTSGVSWERFDPDRPITLGEYVTFLLRALGYRDGKDFIWNTATQKGLELGLYDQATLERAADGVTRGDLAQVSYAALSQPTMDYVQRETLAGRLTRLDVTEGASVQTLGIPLRVEPPIPADVHAQIERVVELVNEARAGEGRGPLVLDKELTICAMGRAQEILTDFSHSRPDGRSCFTILDENGYEYDTAGENIAMGQGSPEAVVRAWLNSPGHRANIMNGDFTRIGVGVEGGGSWVQLFAASWSD